MKDTPMKSLLSILAFTLLSSCVYAKDLTVKSHDTDPWEQPETVTVMAWNIWGRYNLHEDYTINGVTARDRVVEIIKRSKADIICMIETYGSAAAIAEALGYHHYTPSVSANLCIFSRYPLSGVGTPSGLSSFSFLHATATLASGKKVRIHNIWLTSTNNGVGAWARFDSKHTDQQFITSDSNRIRMLNGFFNSKVAIKDLAQSNEIPVIMAGDFNWLSHLDFNAETKAMGLSQNRIIPAPTSLKMAEKGFIDTYRVCNPLNAETVPKAYGYTNTTTGQEWKYRSPRFFRIGSDETPDPWRVNHSRIDYVYSKGARIKPISSYTETTYDKTSITLDFPSFPSDHGAVITTFELSNEGNTTSN